MKKTVEFYIKYSFIIKFLITRRNKYYFDEFVKLKSCTRLVTHFSLKVIKIKLSNSFKFKFCKENCFRYFLFNESIKNTHLMVNLIITLCQNNITAVL